MAQEAFAYAAKDLGGPIRTLEEYAPSGVGAPRAAQGAKAGDIDRGGDACKSTESKLGCRPYPKEHEHNKQKTKTVDRNSKERYAERSLDVWAVYGGAYAERHQTIAGDKQAGCG